MTNKSKIILSLLAAAAAGAAIGVLFAPEKGSDLRKKIKDTTSDWADDMCNLLDIGKKQVKEAYSDAKEYMVDQVEKR